jgi:hypothetical protein
MGPRAQPRKTGARLREAPFALRAARGRPLMAAYDAASLRSASAFGVSSRSTVRTTPIRRCTEGALASMRRGRHLSARHP